MTTKEETLRRIAVMQAWCDGKKIEFNFGASDWQCVDGDPVWNWGPNDYRIAAPKPKRKVTFNAWLAGNELRYVTPFSAVQSDLVKWVRIPTLDLEAEVDD